MKAILLAGAIALAISTDVASAATPPNRDIRAYTGPSAAALNVQWLNNARTSRLNLAGDGSGADVRTNERQLAAGDGSGADVRANSHLA